MLISRPRLQRARRTGGPHLRRFFFSFLFLALSMLTESACHQSDFAAEPSHPLPRLTAPRSVHFNSLVCSLSASRSLPLRAPSPTSQRPCPPLCRLTSSSSPSGHGQKTNGTHASVKRAPGGGVRRWGALSPYLFSLFE